MYKDVVAEYRQALVRLAATVDGRIVLDHLKDVHLSGSSVGKDPHLTYFNLGQAELVAGLLDIAYSLEPKTKIVSE